MSEVEESEAWAEEREECYAAPPRYRDACSYALKIAEEGVEAATYEELSEALRFIAFAKRSRDPELRELGDALDRKISGEIRADAILKMLRGRREGG